MVRRRKMAEQNVGARRTKIRTTLVMLPSSRASSPMASSTCVYAERCAAAASKLSAGSFHHSFPTR